VFRRPRCRRLGAGVTFFLGDWPPREWIARFAAQYTHSRMFMNMKSALAFTILLIGGSLSAQTKTERAQVEWGNACEEKEHGDFQEVLHLTEDHIYVRVFRKRSSWIQKFNKDLTMVKEREIIMELDKQDHSPEATLFQEEDILLFTSVYDKGKDLNTLYVRVFGLGDLAPKGGLKKVHSIPAESKKDQGWFVVEERPTGKGFQVHVKSSGLEKGDTKRKVMIYSEDLTLEDEVDEDFKMPFEQDEFDTEDVIYAADGSKVVVGRKYPEKQEKRERKREGKPTYDMVLLAYGPQGGDPQVTTIPAGDRFLQDMTLKMPENGDILCAGFWGSKGTWSVRGAYFMRLDRESKAIVHQSFKEFDDDFITQHLTDKEAEKATKKAEKKGKELEMLEFDLDEIISREDGGAVLVGEQYRFYVTTNTTSTPNGGTTTTTIYHYVYNDIIAINISPEGDIEWAAKIPKRQHTRNDGGRYSSYALTIKDDKMFFVFNDTGENLMLLPGDKVQQFELKGKEALITLVTVDADGHVHREALLAPDKRDAILMPKECFQMEDDRMFIYASRKKEYRYGMITFE